MIPLLAKWVEVKRAFPNSVIYNYNPTRVHRSGRLKKSRNTLDTMFQKFIDAGLARMEGKHLVLCSKREIADRCTNNKTVDHLWVHLDPSKNIVTQLYAAVMMTKYRQLNHSVMTRDVKGRQSKNLTAAVQRSHRECPVEVSNKGLSKLFEVSISAAARIMNKICSSRIFIRRLQKLTYIRPCSLREWKFLKENFSPSTFWYDGKLFYQQCSQYLPYMVR